MFETKPFNAMSVIPSSVLGSVMYGIAQIGVSSHLMPHNTAEYAEKPF